jgi:hypothetical protein
MLAKEIHPIGPKPSGQSLKQSAIILGIVFAGLIIMWVLVAGLGL